MSLHKRIERLEDESLHSAQSASRAALETLSDEELDALEDTLEAAAGEDTYTVQEAARILRTTERHAATCAPLDHALRTSRNR